MSEGTESAGAEVAEVRSQPFWGCSQQERFFNDTGSLANEMHSGISRRESVERCTRLPRADADIYKDSQASLAYPSINKLQVFRVLL